MPQSEIPAWRQAGAFGMANFFIDETKSQYTKPDPAGLAFFLFQDAKGFAGEVWANFFKDDPDSQFLKPEACLLQIKCNLQV